MKFIKLIFLICIIVSFISCSKAIRNVSDSAALSENEGVLFFTITHTKAPMLVTLNMDILGFDISKPNVPQIAKLWIYMQHPTSRTYKLILPAGRYRIENINSISDDQTIAQQTVQTTIELEYKPRFNFYVTKGKINDLGEIGLIYTTDKTRKGAFPMQSATRGLSTYYIFSQERNVQAISHFMKQYPKLVKQTTGLVYQEISFRPWNRQFEASDPLKQSPTFESGYIKISWKDLIEEARSILQNSYTDTIRMENISNFRFIDQTRPQEISIYDFNNLSDIQFPNGGLYKVTTIQNAKYEDTLNKMKLLYGYYNTEGNKTTWRMVNTMLTLEKLDDNFVRITRVSMEYIRKVATLKPTEIGTIQPTETTLRPAIAQPAAAPATVPNRTEENTQPSGQ